MARTADASVTRSVRQALRGVVDPCSIATGAPITIEEMGLVQRIETNAAGEVLVELCLTSPFCFQAVNIVERIREVVGGIGVTNVQVRIDYAAEWLPNMMSEKARARLRQVRPVRD
jgi:metal-sulfur cluster biosynthetic enzyme